MDKLLFVTTRNISSTCGELRLIKNRSKALYDDWGIITDFIAVCSSKRFKKRNEKMGSESKVTMVVFKNAHPLSIFFSFRKVKKEIREHMQAGMYKCVVLSGIGTLSYVGYIRKLNKDIKIIADIHGAKEDILESAKGKTVLKSIRQRILYSIAEFEEKKYLRRADALFAVSNGMAEYIKKEYHIENTKCYIVPCAADGSMMTRETMQKYRSFYRSKYGIEEEVVLFVYSGGISPWQCIDKSIALFKDIKKNCKIKCKMLILSHEIDKIIPLIGNDSDIIADKAATDEVKKSYVPGIMAF